MPAEVKCGVWDGESQWKYAHLKRDGMWVTLNKYRGVTSAWSRQPRDLTASLKWHPALQAFAELAPDETTLYCELYVADGSRSDVKGAIRDRHHALTIECFAAPHFAGEPVGARLPLDYPEMHAETCGLNFVPYFDVSGDTVRVSDALLMPFVDALVSGEALRDPYSTLGHIGEGFVLKDGNLHNWRKVKPVVTYDLRCVGFTEGREGKTGKMLGLVGAMLLADATGAEVARCSGMTDDERLDMTAHPEKYVGQVVEVEAQGRGSAGGIMHPRFVRVRDDKSEVDAL